MPLINILTGYISHLSYLAVISLLIVSSVGIPVPEDLILLAAGYAASKGIMALSLATLVCFVGVIIGDTIGYLIGRKGGFLLKRLLTKERFVRIEKHFEHHGSKIILISRFLSGIRVFFPIAAGASRMEFQVFLFYDIIAAIIWVPLVTWLGYLFGTHLEAIASVLKKIDIVVYALFAVAVAAFFLGVRFGRKKYTIFKRYKEMLQLKPGEQPYEIAVFGNLKENAHRVIAKIRRKDQRVKVVVEHIRNGKSHKCINGKHWITRESYREKIVRLTKRIGKPFIKRFRK